MKTIHESAYFKIEYDDSTKIIKSLWRGKNNEMNDKKIKEEITIAASKIEDYKPLYILTDDRNRLFIYTVEIQNWVATTLATAGIKAGIKKFAILLPKDIIAKMSTKQTAEEVQNRPYELGLFSDEQKAIEWINS